MLKYLLGTIGFTALASGAFAQNSADSTVPQNIIHTHSMTNLRASVKFPGLIYGTTDEGQEVIVDTRASRGGINNNTIPAEVHKGPNGQDTLISHFNQNNDFVMVGNFDPIIPDQNKNADPKDDIKYGYFVRFDLMSEALKGDRAESPQLSKTAKKIPLMPRAIK